MSYRKFILVVAVMSICFGMIQLAFAKVGGGHHSATCSSECGSCTNVDSCSVAADGTLTCTFTVVNGNVTDTTTRVIVCGDGGDSATRRVNGGDEMAYGASLRGYDTLTRF